MLEVQCDDTQIVAIFGKVVKCSWLAANRINGAADFGRKRTDVLGVISVLCWLGCLGVTALRLGYGNAAGDRKHTTQHKRTFSSETNRLENRRAKHECTQLAAELTGTLVCACAPKRSTATPSQQLSRESAVPKARKPQRMQPA
jgi:hypothetical protein